MVEQSEVDTPIYFFILM